MEARAATDTGTRLEKNLLHPNLAHLLGARKPSKRRSITCSRTADTVAGCHQQGDPSLSFGHRALEPSLVFVSHSKGALRRSPIAH